MIRHIWSVVRASSVIDRDDNKLSLFDIIEQTTVLEPITEPGLMPVHLRLVTLWRRENLDEEAKTTARVRVSAPNGEQISKTFQYTVDLTKYLRLRQRGIFRTLRVKSEGTYEFIVEYPDGNEEWREAARVPLDLAAEGGTLSERHQRTNSPGIRTSDVKSRPK